MIALLSSWTARALAAARRLWTSPHLTLVLLGLFLLFAGIALYEHNASLRREFELRTLRDRTVSEVAALRAEADAAAGRANRENARAIERWEARRRELEREAEQLRERLTALAKQERLRVSQVANLPAAVLAQRVSTRLGPEAEEQVSGARPRRPEDSEAVGRFQVSGNPRLRGNETIPMTPPEAGTDTRHPAPDTSRASASSLSLDNTGLRKIETAFVELDSCREQRAVEAEQTGNCREQLEASARIVETQADSVVQLNHALAAKDEILAKREALYRAELKAARGSWFKRLTRAAEYVGIGVVVGVAVR